MKRFYCTVCKKIKRVQKWPAIISNVSSEFPDQRQGQCNRHTPGFTLPVRQSARQSTYTHAKGGR